MEKQVCEIEEEEKKNQHPGVVHNILSYVLLTK